MERGDSIREPTDRLGDHPAAIAVANQGDVGQVVGLNEANDIVDMVLKAEGRAGLVTASAVTGERNRVDGST